MFGWLAGERLEIVEGLDAGPEGQARLATLPYWVGRSPVIHMPVSLLVMQGALKFDCNHPFVRAINAGRPALERFYREFQPEDIAAMYGLTAATGGGELPPWELPWLLRDRRPPPGEKGLAANDGVSYFGPCSARKIDLELRRLTRLADSIRRHGYRHRPIAAMHIAGHFLRRGDELRFFVRGGKHRTAALVALGYEHVPVRMRDTWPRLISRDQVDDWPLVQAGAMSRAVALKVFDRYFR